MRKIDHYTPQVGFRQKLESNVGAFDTVQQKKNGYFDGQYESTNVSSINIAKRKLDYKQEIPMINSEMEQQWSDEESNSSLNNFN